MFNWLAKKKVAPMHVVPGDTIRIKHTSSKTGRVTFLDHPIEKTASYDTLAVGEITNELGFSDGLVGVVGNEEAADA